MNREPDNLTHRIRTVVNEYDPMRLIAAGVPADEYDAETVLIIEAIGESRDAATLAPRPRRVFEKMFGGADHVRFQDWNEMADDLWDVSRTFRINTTPGSPSFPKGDRV
jgi:hypothetical protein